MRSSWALRRTNDLVRSEAEWKVLGACHLVVMRQRRVEGIGIAAESDNQTRRNETEAAEKFS
jgi:hypothetical protein